MGALCGGGGGVTVLVGSCWANTRVRATSSALPPPLALSGKEVALPLRVTVCRGGSSGKAMQLGAGRVLFHVRATATVAPLPLDWELPHHHP